MSDPFEGIQDEDPLSGDGMRARFLASAKRGYAPLRKAFVQKPDPKKARASVLAAMVTARQERALDAFLLLHALEPALDKDKPLPLATWAKMLSSKNNRWSAQNVGRAFEALETRHLVIRQPKGRGLLVQPQMEDGTGKAWTRPGSDATTVGKGYLVIPYDYWTSGLVDQLSMPGKAMFLIMLSETTLNPTFSMAIERAQSWYGISERTAERGYGELRKYEIAEGQTLLMERRQLVADHRSPTGNRAVWHRALAEPYSQAARAELQRLTRAAARRKAKTEAAKPRLKRLKKRTSNKAGAVESAST
ncbi:MULTISPECIES: hypothetical protein [Catenuloplanes]|uniref:Replication protein n=1 Tax=Catenuloplanes niger TaxID=587534 RepID=A0AAE4CTC5_9ACTN|nr:hypothetical protein [Catenuloplanes niger]MDR7323277.1 hypothetical protein [Catenuloplanes niger]